MTTRQVFEATLIELDKIHAPTLKLFEFNYLCNKAINQFVNKVYNLYSINQQTTDDLRVLNTQVNLSVINNEGILPSDYLHLLNCICVFEVPENKGCYKQGQYIEVPAIKATADSWGQIITDVYNKPSYRRPYYFLHVKNQANNEVEVKKPVIKQTNLSTSFKLNIEENIVEHIPNPINIQTILEIKFGKSNFKLVELQVNYLKCPQFIRLTQEQVDLIDDTSQEMEFPDYVNQEIINELVHLVMERTADPRLSTNIQMTQSIARPTGQQQQQPTAQES